MTNQDRINIINSYQNNSLVHPLTCINSLHQNLIPIEYNNKVILKCLDCSYEQPLMDEFIIMLSNFDIEQRNFQQKYGL